MASDVLVRPPATAPSGAAGRWTPGLAERQVTEVLAVASAALAALAPAPGTDPSLEDTKFGMETALLLNLVDRCLGLPEASRTTGRHIGEALRRLARSERVMRRALVTPALAVELAAAHACLTSIGLPDPGFDRRIRAVIHEAGARDYERLPWKELEQSWIRMMLGAPPVPYARSAAQLTLFARGVDVISASREELYCFTHAVIYATRFGEHLPPLPRSAAAIAADAEAALVRCMTERDYDLAAELLLTWPYLHLAWSGVALAALGEMIAVVDECGMLPSATFDGDEWARRPPGGHDRYFLRESYHTEYVWGFLMLATLQPWGAPAGRADLTTYRRQQELWRALATGNLLTVAGALDAAPDLTGVLVMQARDLVRRYAAWYGAEDDGASGK